MVPATILLVGFASDVAKAESTLLGLGISETARLTEDAASGNVPFPDAADIVVYVVSPDFGYSSQLKSVISHLRVTIRCRMQVWVPVEAVDPARALLPEIKDLPQVSFVDLVGIWQTES